MKQKLLRDLQKSDFADINTFTGETGHNPDIQACAEISYDKNIEITEADNYIASTSNKTEKIAVESNHLPVRQKNATIKVVDETGKCKRKRTSLIDCNQLFAAVQEHIQVDADQLPPLMHTPHSLFRLLCQSFEKQFPNCLAQTSVDEILLSLENKI